MSRSSLKSKFISGYKITEEDYSEVFDATAFLTDSVSAFPSLNSELVKKSLTINSKPLSGNIRLTNADIGSEPASANIQSHISSTGNVHNLTPSQLGVYTSSEVSGMLSTKANLVDGLIPLNELPLVLSEAVSALANTIEIKYLLNASDTAPNNPYIAGSNGENKIQIYNSLNNGAKAFILLPGTTTDGATGLEASIGDSLQVDYSMTIDASDYNSLGNSYGCVVSSRYWTNTDLNIESGGETNYRDLSLVFPDLSFKKGLIIPQSNTIKFDVYKDSNSNRWACVGDLGLLFNRTVGGDGWGNSAYVNSEGYLKRYTLSEEMFYQNTTYVLNTENHCPGNPAIVNTYVDATTALLDPPPQHSLNDVGVDGFLWYSSPTEYFCYETQPMYGPYIAGSNKESKIICEGRTPAFICLPTDQTKTSQNIVAQTLDKDYQVIIDSSLVRNGSMLYKATDTGYCYIFSTNFGFYGCISKTLPYGLGIGHHTDMRTHSVYEFYPLGIKGSYTTYNWIPTFGNMALLGEGQFQGRDGWGNDAEPCADGGLRRFTLGEAQYNELNSQIGRITTLSDIGIQTVSGVLLGDGDGDDDDNIDFKTMMNQTYLLNTDYGIYNVSHIQLSNDFAIGARVRFVDINDEYQLILLPAGHTVVGAKTVNDFISFGICTNNGQDYIKTADVAAGETVELQYVGFNVWTVQFFDFASYVDGSIPWNKIDKSVGVGSYIMGLQTTGYVGADLLLLAHDDDASGDAPRKVSADAIRDYTNSSLKNDIKFNINPIVPSYTEGTEYWDPINHCKLIQTGIDSVTVHSNQESVILVRNNTGSTVLKGTVVNFGLPDVDGISELQISNSTTELGSHIIGVVTQTILSGDTGLTTTFGTLRNFNTSSFTPNAILYSNSLGQLTDIRPIPPNYPIAVAKVINNHATSGSIFIRPANPSSIISLTDQYSTTKDPTGWIDNENLIVSYSTSARTVTLTASVSGALDYMWQGTRKTLGNGVTWTSPVHDTGVNKYFLHSSDGENFNWTITPWDFTDVMVALAVVGTSYTGCIREVHGLMPWQAHKRFHNSIGTMVDVQSIPVSGTYTLDVGTSAACSPGFSESIISDEDLVTTIPALPEGQYTTAYASGGTMIYAQSASGVPFNASAINTFLYYYPPTTGIATVSPTNRFLNVYQLLMPMTIDTNSQLYRMVFIQPQTTYTSLVLAQQEDPKSIILADLATLSSEFVFCTRLTYATTNGYSNYGRCALNGISYIVGSKFSQFGTSGFAPSANSISYVPTAPLTSLTVQTAIDELNTLNAYTVISLATSGTIDITPAISKVKTITPTDAVTFTASGGTAGQIFSVIVTTSGTNSYNINWSTGFISQGTLATGSVSAKTFTINFIFNGASWIETSRTTAM